MIETFLRGEKDFKWLKDVHGVDASEYAVVGIVGNEDCPTRFNLYKEDSVHCEPVVIEYWNLVETTL
jgi:hypothetical protein